MIDDIARSLTCLALAVFIIAMGVAVWAWPGGNSFDGDAAHFSFLGNYWCDLLRETAHNGVANPIASVAAKIALTALAAALAPFWALISRRVASKRLGYGVLTMGLLSTLGAISVPWLPADAFPILHGLAIQLAGPPALVAATAAIVGLWRPQPLARNLGLAAVVAVAVNLVQYSVFYWTSVEESILVPSVQKVATGLMVAWMLAVVAAKPAEVGLDEPPRGV